MTDAKLEGYERNQTALRNEMLVLRKAFAQLVGAFTPVKIELARYREDLALPNPIDSPVTPVDLEDMSQGKYITDVVMG